MRHGLTFAIATLSVAGLGPVSAAASDARCVHDPATATATVSVGPGGAFAGHILPDREGQLVIDDADINPPDPPCGTTANTDTIAITGTLDSASDVFYISNNVANRPFAPGLTDEPGTSDEIEFDVTVTGGTLGITQGLVSTGRAGPTKTVLGKNQVNLNPDEADGVDADVTLSGPSSVMVTGGRDKDIIDADGGAGTPPDPFVLSLTAEGFEGNDRITGGHQRDYLYGSEDRDKLWGEEGGDFLLSGGDGDDVVNGGDGNDRLLGDDGADVIKGGPGRDHCEGGRGRDVFHGCEEVEDP